MNETMIVGLYKKKPKLKNAILITGLPGIGLIGRIAVEHLIKKLNAKKIAEIYSPYFPPNVIISKDGELIPLILELYRAKAGKKDILLLIGDMQPIVTEGQYELAEKIAEFAKSLDVKEIITIGGYATGNLDGKKEIYGAVNNKRLIKKFEKYGIIFGKAKGAIIGFAGLLPIMSRIYNINSICLMATTYGSFADPNGAERVLKMLSSYLKIKIDLTNLEEQSKKNEKLIKKLKEELKKSAMQQERDLSYIR